MATFDTPDTPRAEILGNTSPFIEEVCAARERIADLVLPTPLEESHLPHPNDITTLYKREDLTPVHSFKLRGAANAILSLPEANRERGVLAASAGNHAQGVAYTAQHLGVPATIVMPTTTPEQKVSAVEQFGASVVLHGDSYNDAYQHSLRLQAEKDLPYIHPFDDPHVIAGQATVGLELLAARDDLTHIFVPVGGGGLLAGIVRLVREVRPRAQVIGVEPTDSCMMRRSLNAGKILEAEHVGSFADGVAVKRVGELTFRAAQLADNMITVDDDAICVAMVDFLRESRATLEPAGALALAGLQSYDRLPSGSVAAAICSGANVDNTRLLHALTRAEQANDRNVLLRVGLPERPGALRELCESVVNGHNITQFSYRKNAAAKNARITIGLRVQGPTDKRTLFTALGNGYNFQDLSHNEIVREHGVQAPGDTPDLNNEAFYALEFADRPGALLDLLRNIGNTWNISMFHYGGSEGDVGRVIIGFETTDRADLERVLDEHTNACRRADHDVATMYG